MPRQEALATTNAPPFATHFTDLRQNISGFYGPSYNALSAMHYNGFYGTLFNPHLYVINDAVQQNSGGNTKSINETQKSNLNVETSKNVTKGRKKKRKGLQVNANEQSSKRSSNKKDNKKGKEKKGNNTVAKKKKQIKKLKREALKQATFEQDTWRTPKKREKPWLIKDPNVNYTSATQRLHYEIIELVNYLLPTDIERLLRAFVIKRIELVIKEHFQKAEVMVFGSVNTGLYLPTSDIDIACFIHAEPRSAIFAIAKLFETLNISDGTPTIIALTRVPIIKFQEYHTKFNVDICINHIGGYYSAVAVRRYMERWPSLGTLLHPKIQTGSIIPNDENLGVLLIEFFELYGVDFNYKQLAIRVERDDDLGMGIGYCKKENEPWATKCQEKLCIQDPVQKSNDIAKATTIMPKIREHFERAFNILVNRVCTIERNSSRNGDIIVDLQKHSILSSILFIRREVINRRRKLHNDFISGKQLGQAVAPFGTGIANSLRLPDLEYIGREFREEIEDIIVNKEQTIHVGFSQTKIDSQIKEGLINNRSNSDMDLSDPGSPTNHNMYGQSFDPSNNEGSNDGPNKGCGVQ
ncbi:7410_t:CDS:2 [Cetraspora pellucida]|uniref:7410_t:CDS:1 n=1 Tax=Cetraspora pellucida TaxID=1433469 RepID=A0ACA9KBX7_9GLOM|nr:7410_t:CDS:2 [Cetraspora pellucida]